MTQRLFISIILLFISLLVTGQEDESLGISLRTGYATQLENVQGFHIGVNFHEKTKSV